MKFFIIMLALVGLTACNQTPKSDLKTDKAKASYSIGQQVGGNFKTQEVDLDIAAFSMAVSDVIAGKKPALTADEMQKAMMQFQQTRMDKTKVAAEKSKASAVAYLEKNKTVEGFKVTASGLQYKVVTTGKGPTPKDKDFVMAHYSGKLTDGTEFDSSYKRGQPAEFPVMGVIPGWTEALKMMKVGDKWQLVIPPELAYGEGGRPGIPPNSVLVFDIELVGIKGKK
ncbi:MAG: FKBP-type peptidyl-prolyl cis-trans isomerase [Oligoflexia bacterium]|nr:FKBP-type peptidyl-prolyl cis-trans isomerase [Oligoflexia bacterium]